ncbi:CIA30 family protein [Neosynechococcus sphagnicola]|uniref:CIA30 family protein n=1 Tax=Neosynechococcus sphagnicola TaxID=1501145 RepID=UPI00068F0432|nr:CIA30 family protein [Neosynechococcus sphagnicola]
MSNWDWFQPGWGNRPRTQFPGLEPLDPGVFLVVGATSEVGQRILRQLLDRGMKVRSLVQDAAQARDLLGADTEIIAVDLRRPETLTAQVTAHLRAVICCLDTLDIEDISNLLQACVPTLQSTPLQPIFQFSSPVAVDLQALWGAVDDVVMGGVSESSFRVEQGLAWFTGTVSTANSGGFASVRTRNLEPPLSLENYDGLKLRVRGNGDRYKFLVRTESGWDSIAYSYSFDTVTDTWIDVWMPFREFVPVFRAKTVPTAAPLDTRCIRALQLILSKFEYDGALNPKFTPGEFQLCIESIAAYPKPPTDPSSILRSPQVILVSETVTTGSAPSPAMVAWQPQHQEFLHHHGICFTLIEPTGEIAPTPAPTVIPQGCKGLDDLAHRCVAALLPSE